MKQVLKTIESLILNSKYQLVILFLATAMFMSSCKKEEIQSSSQKEELQSISQKQDLMNNSQKHDLLNSAQKQNVQEKSVPFTGKFTL